MVSLDFKWDILHKSVILSHSWNYQIINSVLDHCVCITQSSQRTGVLLSTYPYLQAFQLGWSSCCLRQCCSVKKILENGAKYAALVIEVTVSNHWPMHTWFFACGSVERLLHKTVNNTDCCQDKSRGRANRPMNVTFWKSGRKHK